MAGQDYRYDFTQRQTFSTYTFIRVILVALVVFLGFASAAHAAQITLAWDASTQPEVTGYKIYWGTSSGNYSSSVDVGNVTTYTVTALNSGTTYYFVATCYTGTGAESGYSNQVSSTTPTVNTAPVASNGSLTVSARQTTSGKLVATDADGNSLTYSIVTAPGKGTLTITNAATGAFTYTANANTTTTDFFTFRAYDGTAYSNNASVSISITAVNTAPVASNGSLSVSGKTPASGKLVATDADGNALTYSIVTAPGKGTLTITNAGTGAFTYTANANTATTDSFTFRAYDGTAYSNTATVSISIAAGNTAPVASNGSLSVSGKTPASGKLVATDADGNALTYSIVAAPGKGTLTITNAATGAFTYTANANTATTDSFTFRAYDGIAYSNTANVSISITAGNTAPVAKNGTLNVSGKKPASGNLVATDADGNALTYSIVTAPGKGTVTITNAATGAFTYTANANTAAIDSFTFRAHDGIAYSNTATVAVANTGDNAAPVASNGSLSVSGKHTTTGKLIATDADGNSLTYSMVAKPTKGKVNITNAATGAYTYAANSDATGTDTFTFKANDRLLDSNVATITVTITDSADNRARSTLSVAPGWFIEVTGDFNGDGKMDIFWRNTATGQNVLWYMNGAEFLGSESLPAVSDPNWRMVGKGDFNGDGKLDILWRNSASGANVVWYLDGAQFLSAANLSTVSDQSWTVVGTGDFNGDGKLDILWRNSASGANVVWYLDGVQFLSAANLSTVSDQSWTIVGTGDFNADGKIDILWRNTATGVNVVWYLDGVQFLSAAYLFTVSDQSWTIVGTGDFNADGKTDILWRNTATGTNAIWYMDLAQFIGAENLYAFNEPA